MAEQKNVQPQQRGGKKKSGSPKKSGEEKKGSAGNYTHILSQKAKNVKRHLDKQRKAKADANRPSRTERGHARAMRRASIALTTGAARNLAAAERRLKPAPEEPTLDQQIAGTITGLFGDKALDRFEAEKAKAAETGA